jgi:23S rRNA pseudouridine1911/1915/1917 synthase
MLQRDRTLTFSFAELSPQRLDKYLVTCMPEFSRSQLQGLIKAGMVEVNSQPIQKASQILEKAVVIKVYLPPIAPSYLVPETIPLEIIFENNDLMVVNKPAGMVVHPAAGHPTGTLVHAALAHSPDLEGVGGEQRPGVVHRLDKDTSGLILLAKNDTTHRWLQNQFKGRQVEKVYLALVDGSPPTPTGRVEASIGRDPTHRKKMAITQPDIGRSATSEYHTLESYRTHTLLEVHPVTGRTHQIRLHLAFIGCPVVGDTIYGRVNPTLPIKRYFLHAARLTIVIPGETKPHTFEALLPDELTAILDRLRIETNNR